MIAPTKRDRFLAAGVQLAVFLLCWTSQGGALPGVIGAFAGLLVGGCLSGLMHRYWVH